MFRFRSRRRSLGFTLVEVMAVSGIMAGLHAQGNYKYAFTAANRVKAMSNLKQVGLLLMIQCQTDKLPDAALYPKDDPKKDPKSITRLVKGAPAELFVSPCAPDALKKTGLTFAWNDSVNGKTLDTLPGDTWLLIDVAAFIADPKVPKPDAYIVLYADGSVKAIDKLPDDIARAVKDAQAKAATPEPKGEK